MNAVTNPYEPHWKERDDCTEAQWRAQHELREQRTIELAKRGLVEEQRKIEKLRDRGALFAISHSGGKDSQTMAIKIQKLVPQDQIVWVHAPLKGVEWAGGIEQILRYKPRNIPLLFAEAIDEVEAQKWLLEWVVRRGAWPSKSIRWCTSDFKRGPIRREIKRYADAHGYTIIVDAEGLRAEESDDRARRPALEPLEAEHGVKSRALGLKREWYSWSPIKWDSTQDVFETIHRAGQIPMWTYVEGMTRSSCAFCIMASIADLRRATELAPEVYAGYVAVEKFVGHTIQTRRGTREQRQAYAREHHLGKEWADKKSSVMRYPLESVTGVQADPALVRKYLRRLEKTGKIRDPEFAGKTAYRHAMRKGVTTERLRVLRTRHALGQMRLGVAEDGARLIGDES